MPGHDQLVDAVYEAALMPGGWPSVLEGLAGCFDLKSACLLRSDPGDPGVVRLADVHRMPQRLVDDYNERFHQRDEAVRASRAFPVGTFLSVCDALGARDWERSDFYNRVNRPYGIYHVMGATLAVEADHFVALAMHRDKRQGDFDPPERRSFQRLVPHLVRAVRIERGLSAAEDRAHTLEGLLDRFHVGVLIADPSGRELAANEEARRILRRRDGLCDTMGVLVASWSCESRRLREVLASVRGPESTRGGVLHVSRPSGLPDLEILVAPVGPAAAGVPAAGPLAAVVVSDRARPGVVSAPLIRELLGVTVSEAEVCALLARGRTLEEIALRRGVSRATVQTQIKSVFHKTGIRRQAELVARILQGPAGLVGEPGNGRLEERPSI